VSAQRKPMALDADVETAYTMADGRQVTTHGHYYRSRDGQVREESALGAVITDMRTGTITVLNTERKEARVVKMPVTNAQTRRPSNHPNPQAFEESELEGHMVTKVRASGPRGDSQEIWTAKDLGLVVLSRVH